MIHLSETHEFDDSPEFDPFPHQCEAWDCDPSYTHPDESYDRGLDEEDDTGDWQVIVLDRFGDRLVTAQLHRRGEA